MEYQLVFLLYSVEFSTDMAIIERIMFNPTQKQVSVPKVHKCQPGFPPVVTEFSIKASTTHVIVSLKLFICEMCR